MVEKAGCDFAGFASLGALSLSLFFVRGFNMIGSFMSGFNQLYGPTSGAVCVENQVLE